MKPSWCAPLRFRQRLGPPASTWSHPWTVNAELDPAGGRRYSIGAVAIDPADMLHIRYKSSADNARGTGPLDAGLTLSPRWWPLVYCFGT